MKNNLLVKKKFNNIKLYHLKKLMKNLLNFGVKCFGKNRTNDKV